MKKRVGFGVCFAKSAFVGVTFLSFTVLGLTLGGCTRSSGGEGSGTPTDAAKLGDTLNSDYETANTTVCDGVTSGVVTQGGLTLNLPAGSLSACARASAPSVTTDTSLPSALQLFTGDSNVTDGATSYGVSFGANAQHTKILNSNVATLVATLAVPFSSATVDASKVDSTHIYLKVFLPDRGLTLNLVGSVSVSGGQGTLTVPLVGVPPSMTVVVVYNPNMVAVANDSVSLFSQTPSTWGASDWCVLYDPTDANLITQVQKYLGITSVPSLTQMATVAKDKIANVARIASLGYQYLNYRSPRLNVYNQASDPCGSSFNTTPRFNIHIHHSADGSYSSSLDPAEPLGSDGVRFGSLYIQDTVINYTFATDARSSLNTVAHELFHQIQDGYEFGISRSTFGFCEGTATPYGVTVDRRKNVNALETPSVRSLSDGETMLLSNYLLNPFGVAAYANQDFFVYLAHRYCGGELEYNGALMQQFHSDVAAYAAGQADPAVALYAPPMWVLRDALGLFLQGNCGSLGLKEVYFDFIKQRAMEHNSFSRYNRTNEITSGFASKLFATGGWSDLSLDPNSASSQSATFGKVTPFASRAIRIKPSQLMQVGSTAGTLKVVLSFSNQMSLGTEVFGVLYRNGKAQTLTAENTLSGFGASTDDEIVVLLSNVNKLGAVDMTYAISVEPAPAPTATPTPPSAGGSSTFTFGQFTINATTITVHGITTTPAGLGSDLIMTQISGSSSVMNPYPVVQIFFNPGVITRAGTFVIGTDASYADKPVSVLYASMTPAKVFTVNSASGGTVTLTSWSSAVGGHITGSLTVNMINSDVSPAETGTVTATFDLIVGDSTRL